MFQKFSSMEKNLWIRDEGVTFFRRKIVVSQCQKIFLGEPFNVSEIFGYRKVLCLRRGFHPFLLKLFCLTVQKICGEPSNVSENFGYRKILCIRKGVHYFLLKLFLSHSAEKFRSGTLLCFKKILVSKIFMHRRGGDITVLSKKVLSHRTETKNLVREPYCFPWNFWYRKNFMGKRGGGLSRFCSVKS